MYKIINVLERQDLIEASIDYFWHQWGFKDNRNFFEDAIKNSSINDMPSFYVVLNNGKIVASYALLMNDLISRQDLYPWFACLLVSPQERGNRLGSKLLKHASEQAKLKGYSNLYLITNLDNYYEKYDWEYFANGYLESGKEKKLYRIKM